MEPAPAYVLVPANEWADFKETVRETRQFAMEARDIGLSAKQTLSEVVAPKLLKVDAHEEAIQQTNGALWAFGIIGSLVALLLGILAWVR
ncbi:MAG: hypothetical protein LC623_05705 [Halobacteriales archaeon]|nr:hypothetical protein [Halobacteriales archaeon]